MAKFHELCPERSEKYEEIRKFFEKIIKKKKKKPEKVEKAEGEEDEEEEENEEEEEDEDEDEDEDENTITGLTNEDHKIEDIEKLREERRVPVWMLNLDRVEALLKRHRAPQLVLHLPVCVAARVVATRQSESVRHLSTVLGTQ